MTHVHSLTLHAVNADDPVHMPPSLPHVTALRVLLLQGDIHVDALPHMPQLESLAIEYSDPTYTGEYDPTEHGVELMPFLQRHGTIRRLTLRGVNLLDRDAVFDAVGAQLTSYCFDRTVDNAMWLYGRPVSGDLGFHSQFFPNLRELAYRDRVFAGREVLSDCPSLTVLDVRSWMGAVMHDISDNRAFTCSAAAYRPCNETPLQKLPFAASFYQHLVTLELPLDADMATLGKLRASVRCSVISPSCSCTRHRRRLGRRATAAPRPG